MINGAHDMISVHKSAQYKNMFHEENCVEKDHLN